ncbi:hypothetical protein HDU76_012771, partial [Blyttiomyces sp. JEL0837]
TPVEDAKPGEIRCVNKMESEFLEILEFGITVGRDEWKDFLGKVGGIMDGRGVIQLGVDSGSEHLQQQQQQRGYHQHPHPNQNQHGGFWPSVSLYSGGGGGVVPGAAAAARPIHNVARSVAANGGLAAHAPPDFGAGIAGMEDISLRSDVESRSHLSLGSDSWCRLYHELVLVDSETLIPFDFNVTRNVARQLYGSALNRAKLQEQRALADAVSISTCCEAEIAPEYEETVRVGVWRHLSDVHKRHVSEVQQEQERERLKKLERFGWGQSSGDAVGNGHQDFGAGLPQLQPSLWPSSCASEVENEWGYSSSGSGGLGVGASGGHHHLGQGDCSDKFSPLASDFVEGNRVGWGEFVGTSGGVATTGQPQHLQSYISGSGESAGALLSQRNLPYDDRSYHEQFQQPSSIQTQRTQSQNSTLSQYQHPLDPHRQPGSGSGGSMSSSAYVLYQPSSPQAYHRHQAPQPNQQHHESLQHHQQQQHQQQHHRGNSGVIGSTGRVFGSVHQDADETAEEVSLPSLSLASLSPLSGTFSHLTTAPAVENDLNDPSPTFVDSGVYGVAENVGVHGGAGKPADHHEYGEWFPSSSSSSMKLQPYAGTQQQRLEIQQTVEEIRRQFQQRERERLQQQQQQQQHQLQQQKQQQLQQQQQQPQHDHLTFVASGTAGSVNGNLANGGKSNVEASRAPYGGSLAHPPPSKYSLGKPPPYSAGMPTRHSSIGTTATPTSYHPYSSQTGHPGVLLSSTLSSPLHIPTPSHSQMDMQFQMQLPPPPSLASTGFSLSMPAAIGGSNSAASTMPRMTSGTPIHSMTSNRRHTFHVAGGFTDPLGALAGMVHAPAGHDSPRAPMDFGIGVGGGVSMARSGSGVSAVGNLYRLNSGHGIGHGIGETMATASPSGSMAMAMMSGLMDDSLLQQQQHHQQQHHHQRVFSYTGQSPQQARPPQPQLQSGRYNGGLQQHLQHQQQQQQQHQQQQQQHALTMSLLQSPSPLVQHPSPLSSFSAPSHSSYVHQPGHNFSLPPAVPPPPPPRHSQYHRSSYQPVSSQPSPHPHPNLPQTHYTPRDFAHQQQQQQQQHLQELHNLMAGAGTGLSAGGMSSGSGGMATRSTPWQHHGQSGVLGGLGFGLGFGLVGGGSGNHGGQVSRHGQHSDMQNQHQHMLNGHVGVGNSMAVPSPLTGGGTSYSKGMLDVGPAACVGVFTTRKRNPKICKILAARQIFSQQKIELRSQRFDVEANMMSSNSKRSSGGLAMTSPSSLLNSHNNSGNNNLLNDAIHRGTNSSNSTADPASLLPKKRAIVEDGRKKIHTAYPDGSETIEEYDLRTDELLIRRTRGKSILGKIGPWVYEIGEPPRSSVATVTSLMADVQISESPHAPQVSRKDSPEHFIFRIRNLAYPKMVYQITVEGRQLVVRTTNKKYFTRLSISDMDRMNLELASSALTWDHNSNTLVIKYAKPAAIKQKEQKEREERAKMNTDNHREGDMDCKTQ